MITGRAVLLALALAVAPGLTARASAQEPAAPALPGSPSLAADHWAVRAAARTEAMGLVARYLPAQRSVPLAAVASALAQAAARAPGERPAAEALTRGWWDRFSEEFPGMAARFGGEGEPLVLGGAAGAGYRAETGRVEAGAGLFQRRSGPTALPDDRGAALDASVSLLPARFLGVRAAPGMGPERPERGRWDVTLGWRSLALSAGEQPVGYTAGLSGGVILSGTTRMPRVEVQTARPVSLPGVLRHLGPTSFHTFGTRFSEERQPGDPWLWGMRAAVRPHPRLTVAVNRASVFGGDSISTPVTAANLARMLIGTLSLDFENQLVSTDFRFRLPTERVLPLTAYLEWGAEDAAGAWWDVPGTVLGVLVPALPRLPQVALGAEWTRLPPECCGNPPWYLHTAFPGGWTWEGRPLGHPLGGEGEELLVYGSGDFLDARLRVDARAFARERGDRGYRPPRWSGNLYAPDRAGTSFGGDVSAAWRLAPRSDLRLSLQRESGDGWTRQGFEAAVSFLF